MMRRPALAALLALILAPAAFAQAPADCVDDYVKAEMQRQHIPGIALAVVRDGTVTKIAGYGVADREKNIPVATSTAFKIGSVSKQFIATAIMLLAQDGKLKVDDPVRTYLPDAPEAWNGITLRHLLSHTAGLIREGPAFEPFTPKPDIDVVRSGYARALQSKPGEKYSYSNLGYFTLAEIITRVSGRPWTRYIGEKVFAASGMTASRPTTTDAFPNKATGYTGKDRLAPAVDWPAVRPSGAFFSTVEDLARWEAVLVTDAVLREAARKQMWTDVRLNDGSPAGYGFGWSVGTLAGRAAVHHGGSLPGFRAFYLRFIDERLAVIVLGNGDDADLQSLAVGVATRVLPAAAPR
ncbi:MAG: serine hydrolase domain-containing protein [Vicinamibacteraceae bacterium]